MTPEERLTRLIEQHEELTRTVELLAAEYRESLRRERNDGNPNPEESGK
jgi:hypothetical protein